MHSVEGALPAAASPVIRHFRGLRRFLSAVVVALVVSVLLLTAWDRLRGAEEAGEREATNLQRLYELHILRSTEQLQTMAILLAADPLVAEALVSERTGALRAHMRPLLRQLTSDRLLEQLMLLRPDGSVLAHEQDDATPLLFSLPDRLRAGEVRSGFAEGEADTLMLASAAPVRAGGSIVGHVAIVAPLHSVLDALPPDPTRAVWVYGHQTDPNAPWPLWERVSPQVEALSAARGDIFRLTAGGTAVDVHYGSDLEVHGRRIHVSAFPLTGPAGEHAAHLVVAQDTSAWSVLYRGAFAYVTAAAALLTAVLLMILVHTTRRLAATVASSHEDLEMRVAERTAALERVNGALRLEITLRQQAEEQTRRLQAERFHIARLYTLGQLASEIAHEVSQPLAAIGNYAGACLRASASDQLSRDELREGLTEIRAQATRAAETVVHLRNFSQRRTANRTPTDLKALLVQACDFMRTETARCGTRVDLELPEQSPRLNIDPVLIEQVLINLIRNALEAMQALPEHERRLHIALRVESGAVELTVADNGCGLPPDFGDSIFEPFTTSKPDGMGIGLPVSREIVELHHGTLCAGHAEPRGALFTIRLPDTREDSDD